MKMNKTIQYGTIVIAAVLLSACQRRGAEPQPETRPVHILSAVSYDKVTKTIALQSSPLENVRFLRKDGPAPTSMTDAVPFLGKRAADGSIAWQGTTPLYDRTDLDAYFVAYHPQGTETPNTQTDWPIDGKTDILLSAPWSAGKYSAPKTGTEEGQTPLTFLHALARLELICQLDPATPAEQLHARYGKIKSITYYQTLPTATYTYATNAVTFSGTKVDRPLFQADCETDFAPIAIPVAGNTLGNAGAMLAPATGKLALLIATEHIPLQVVEVELTHQGAAQNFEAGLKHAVTITFSLRGITVSGTQIAAWDAGHTAASDAQIPVPYVEVNGLRWATGNLVADGPNGCKIGQPSDYGLYFQFGSLVGWTGGSGDGTGTGSPALDKAVWPLAMGVSKPDYDGPANDGSTAGDRNTVVDQYFFNYNMAPYSTAGQDIRGFSGSFAGDAGTGNLGTGRYAKWGVGDPCTYYLGASWRLPTTNEIVALCNNKGGGNWALWDDVDGSWMTSPTPGGNFVGNQLFFPASGYRDISNGSLYTVGTYGLCWSSSVGSATYGYNLLFDQPNGVNTQNNGSRSGGFPVRCVGAVASHPVNPPAASDYVEINGLRWAKGNLIAKNNMECKVGAPSDGGLYFQFGSLIGYKGGNQANGGSGVGAPLITDGTFWNGADSYSWANEAMVWPTELVGTKTSWTNTVGSNISTLSDYYFNYSVAPWDVASSTDIGLFGVTVSGQGSSSGNLRSGRYANLGVGDPCTYYLGGTWRTPTTEEIVKLCNGQGGGDWVPWETAGGSWAISPPYGGNFYSNKLFFPVSGCRDGSNGAFYLVTTYGYYWGSSVYDAPNGYSLSFNQPTGVIPQYGTNRSNGFPVRCVSSGL